MKRQAAALVGVAADLRASHEKPVVPPKSCPACGGNVVKEEEFAAYRCDNPSYPAQLKRLLLYFSSRPALDMQGLGEAVVDQLVDSGRIQDVARTPNWTSDLRPPPAGLKAPKLIE